MDHIRAIFVAANLPTFFDVKKHNFT